jgi:hypothetical protein
MNQAHGAKIRCSPNAKLWLSELRGVVERRSDVLGGRPRAAHRQHEQKDDGEDAHGERRVDESEAVFAKFCYNPTFVEATEVL